MLALQWQVAASASLPGPAKPCTAMPVVRGLVRQVAHRHIPPTTAIMATMAIMVTMHGPCLVDMVELASQGVVGMVVEGMVRQGVVVGMVVVVVGMVQVVVVVGMVLQLQVVVGTAASRHKVTPG